MVLCRTNDSGCGTPIHTALLSRATPFFHFPTLARDDSEYVLKLECTLARSMYSFTEPAAGFFAAGPHKHITFRFEPQVCSSTAVVVQGRSPSSRNVFVNIETDKCHFPNR